MLHLDNDFRIKMPAVPAPVKFPLDLRKLEGALPNKIVTRTAKASPGGFIPDLSDTWLHKKGVYRCFGMSDAGQFCVLEFNAPAGDYRVAKRFGRVNLLDTRKAMSKGITIKNVQKKLRERFGETLLDKKIGA